MSEKISPPKTIEEGLKRMYYKPDNQGCDFSLDFIGGDGWRVMCMDSEVLISWGRTAMSAIRKACIEEGV